MKKLLKLTLLLLVMVSLLLAMPGPVAAQTPTGNESPVIFGSSYTLESGQTVKDIVVFGGNATLKKGSTVTGDVVVFGGDVVVSGEVRGDVTCFGGNVQVLETALIGGDLNSLGGSAQVSPEATVKGSRFIGGTPLRVPTKIYAPGFWADVSPAAGAVSAVFFALMVALLAVLIALFLPAPIDRIAQTIGNQPVISGAVGLLTLVVVPALFIALSITVILIPLGLVGILVFFIAMLFGWTATGVEIGKRLAALTNTQWATPVSAGVGTLLLSLVAGLGVYATAQSFWTLCCLGIPLLMVICIIGLGGVVASKFGMTVYNPNPYRPAYPSAQPSYAPPAVPPAPWDQPQQPPAPPSTPPWENPNPPAGPTSPLPPPSGPEAPAS